MSNFTSRAVSQGGKRFKKKKDRTIARTRKDKKQDERLNKLDKKISRVLNDSDLKYNDVYFAEAGVGTTPEFTLLNGIANGVTDDDRLGDKIRMTSLQFRMTIRNNIDASLINQVRIMVVRDRQANGTVPTYANSPSSGLAILNNAVITAQQYAPYMHEASNRFKIYYDKTVVLNPMYVEEFNVSTGETTAVGEVEVYLSRYIKLGTIVKYSGTTVTSSSIATNSLWMVIVSNNNTNSPLITWGARVYYKDL